MPVREINLDEARAARAEITGETIIVIFAGHKFHLPAEYPARFAFNPDPTDDASLLRELLGTEQFDEFMKLNPSFTDVETLFDQAAVLYGADLGLGKVTGDDGAGSSSPSMQSDTPSPSIGGPSKPTGVGSTKRTSGKSSGAKARSASAG